MASETSSFNHGPESQTRRPPLWVYFTLLLILLWAFGLRMYQLDSRPFWGDETITGALAHLGPASVLRTTAPVLFLRQLGKDLGGELVTGWGYQMPLPLLTSLTTLIGKQDMLVRLPALLAGILAIAAAYALGRRIFNVPVGLILAFLLATASFQVRYAQEARYYSLMFCLSVISAYVLWRALEENRARFWIGFIVLSILNVWNHLFAVFFLIPMVLYAGTHLAIRMAANARLSIAGRNRRALPPRHPTLRSRLLHWQQLAWSALREAPLLYLGSAIAIVALLVLTSEVVMPVARAAMGATTSARTVNVGFPLATGGVAAAEQGLQGFSLSVPTLVKLFALFGSGNGWPVVVYLILAGLGVVYVVASRQWRAAGFLGIWLVLPLVMVSLVRSDHFFLEKYIIFVQLPYLAFVALGIYAVWSWLLRPLMKGSLGRFPWPALAAGVLAIALVAMNAQSVLGYHQMQDRLNWRGVVEYLESKMTKDDAVVYVTSRVMDWGPFEYYFKLQMDRDAYGDFVTTFEKLSAQQMQRVFDSHKRIWIVDHIYSGGFKEMGALFPGVQPTYVAGVPVYLINSAPVMASHVPFKLTPGEEVFQSAHGVVNGQDLIVALALADPAISQKFAVFVSGQWRGELDPSGQTAPDFVRIPITSTQVSSIALAPVSGAATDTYSGTLTTTAGVALPAQADTRVEAESYPTDNGFIYPLEEASGGYVVRAQGFNTIARFPLWLSKPGDYLLSVHGRLGAGVGTPIWSVVLNRQAVGTISPREIGNWEEHTIPLHLERPGLHELIIGVTANAYVENGYADLDFVTLQARENWIWRGSNQIDLTTTPENTCGSESDTPGRWLDDQPVLVPITVDETAPYVVKAELTSNRAATTFDVTLDDGPLGQIKATPGQTNSDILFAELSPGQHLITITPPDDLQAEQACLQSLVIERVYVPRDDGALRVDANPLILGEASRLQQIGAETAAVSARTGTTVQAGLWFEDIGNYTLDISGLNDQPAPVKLQVELDGHPVGEPISFDRNDYTWSTLSTLLPVAAPGYHQLRINFANDYYDDALVASQIDGDRNAAVQSFSITKLQAPIIAVSTQLTLDLASNIDILAPGSNVVELEDGPAVLRAGDGRVADVDLAFDTAGGYRLVLNGQNDRPGPVELDVLVDDVAVGQVSFSGDDGSWSDESLLFTVALPGYHRLSLDFVNDFYDDNLVKQGLDGDRNIALRRLELTKVPAAIGKSDTMLEVVFDDVLAAIGETAGPHLARVDSEFALVFEPGAELEIPTAFLDESTYVFELTGRSERLSSALEVTLGDVTQSLVFGNATEPRFVGTKQPAGVQSVKLRNVGQQTVYLEGMRLYAVPLFTDDIFAWTVDQGYVAPGAAAGQDQGRSAVIRGGVGPIVEIPVVFPKTGVYRVNVQGQNDQPGPVILDVLIDDVQQAQIYFNADDGSWDTRSVQVAIAEPGLHTLTLAFNNDFYDQKRVDAGQDGDRNALIDRITVTRSGS